MPEGGLARRVSQRGGWLRAATARGRRTGFLAAGAGDELERHREVGAGAAGGRIEVEDVPAGAGHLGEAHVGAHLGGEDAIAVALPHPGHGGARQAGAVVDHRRQQPEEPRPEAEAEAQPLGRFEQQVDAVGGERLRRHRHDEAVRSGESVERHHRERRRAVEEDPVVLVAQRLEPPSQGELAVAQRGELDVGRDQVDRGGHQVEPRVERRADHRRGALAAEEQVAGGGSQLGARDAERERGRGLAVEVDEQRAVAEEGERGRDVHRARRLPHAPLLADERDDQSLFLTRKCNASRVRDRAPVFRL